MGDHEVSAAADGYESRTQTVIIEKGATASLDFALQAIPAHTVFGTVSTARADGYQSQTRQDVAVTADTEVNFSLAAENHARRATDCRERGIDS